MALQTGGDVQNPWPPLQEAVDQIVFREGHVARPEWAQWGPLKELAVTAFAALKRLKVDMRDLFRRVEELETRKIAMGDAAAVAMKQRIDECFEAVNTVVDAARLHLQLTESQGERLGELSAQVGRLERTAAFHGRMVGDLMEVDFLQQWKIDDLEQLADSIAAFVDPVQETGDAAEREERRVEARTILTDAAARLRAPIDVAKLGEHLAGIYGLDSGAYAKLIADLEDGMGAFVAADTAPTLRTEGCETDGEPWYMIVRHPYRISEAMQAARTYGGPNLAQIRHEKLVEHLDHLADTVEHLDRGPVEFLPGRALANREWEEFGTIVGEWLTEIVDKDSPLKPRPDPVMHLTPYAAMRLQQDDAWRNATPEEHEQTGIDAYHGNFPVKVMREWNTYRAGDQT